MVFLLLLLTGAADLLVGREAFGDFDVDAARETDAYLAPFESLLLDILGAGQHLDVGLLPFELQGAFGQRQHVFATLDQDVRIGAVTGADENILGHLPRGLHLEHDDAVFLGGFGRDVLQPGVELDILQGADG